MTELKYKVAFKQDGELVEILCSTWSDVKKFGRDVEVYAWGYPGELFISCLGEKRWYRVR